MAVTEHTVQHDYPSFWARWFYSTNHKDIGILYLIFSLITGVVGGLLSIGIRMELQGSSKISTQQH